VPLSAIRSHRCHSARCALQGPSQARGAADSWTLIRGMEAIRVVMERTSLNEPSRSYTMVAPVLHPGRGLGVVAISEGTSPEEAFVA